MEIRSARHSFPYRKFGTKFIELCDRAFVGIIAKQQTMASSL